MEEASVGKDGNSDDSNEAAVGRGLNLAQQPQRRPQRRCDREDAGRCGAGWLGAGFDGADESMGRAGDAGPRTTLKLDETPPRSRKSVAK